eukprot:GHVN01006708.1.p1 GENE.GHVN01006708.1~~GHVN01006708.1.p1  ORF type:complete len:317 (+),score=37.77 GHVN01006708.1:563-1513(+)
MYNYTTEAFHMYSYNAQTMLVGCLSKAQDVPASFGLSQRMTQQNGAKQSFSPRIEGVFLILGQSRLLEQHNKRHQGQCYSRDTSTSARSSGFPTMTVICLWLLYLFYFNCLKMPQKELVSAPLSDGGTYLETFFVNPTHKEDGDPIEIESPFDDSSPPTTARSHYALSARKAPTRASISDLWHPPDRELSNPTEASGGEEKSNFTQSKSNVETTALSAKQKRMHKNKGLVKRQPARVATIRHESSETVNRHDSSETVNLTRSLDDFSLSSSGQLNGSGTTSFDVIVRYPKPSEAEPTTFWEMLWNCGCCWRTGRGS